MKKYCLILEINGKRDFILIDYFLKKQPDGEE